MIITFPSLTGLVNIFMGNRLYLSCSLVPRLISQAFIACIKSLGDKPGNEAIFLAVTV